MVAAQEDKTKELIEKLEKGIRETMDSENYKAFLRVQSQFHTYSYNNALLIYLQKPDATRVAGYMTWKKLERHPMKGTGISILAPSPYTYHKLVDKKDPNTNKPEIDPNTGEIKKIKVEMQGMSFRKVSVFDIKDTIGKELPTICNELQGNSINAENIIKAIKNISDVPVIERPIESGAKGYYSRSENIIAIKENMSLDQTAKTLIHEYAHSQLHNTAEAALLDRATKEVQAESVAYIVSNRFGVDTSEYSFSYLASWSSGKELTELKSSFKLIQKTADKIIQGIEEVLSKEMQLQNSPAKIVIQWSESEKLQKGQILDVVEANKLFVKLDQEQAELIKATNLKDYSKVAAGDDVPYVPYLKTKFELQLSDGRTSMGRFDIGESGYKDLFDCIKRECKIDVIEYVKQNEANKIQEAIPEESKNVSTGFQSIKDKVVDAYSKAFPAIKYISENTAQFIDDMNQKQGKIVSVNEIKQAYKDAGKALENSNSLDDKKIFDRLQNVVDDFKQAQLKDMQIKAHELGHQFYTSKTMEMTL